MRHQQCLTILGLAAVLGLIVTPGFGAGDAAPDPTATLKPVYEQQLARIEAEYAQAGRTLNTRYVQDLQTLKGRVRQAGDLNGLMAVDAELQRFESDRTIPDASPPGQPESLLELQAKHRKARTDQDSEHNAKMVSLGRLYLQRLEALKKTLTIDGKLPEALAVNTEIERVKASPVLLAADFAAAVEPAAPSPPRAAQTNTAAAGPTIRDLKLPEGVVVQDGVKSATDGFAMKTQSLSPTSRARLTRKLSATVSIGEAKGMTGTKASTVYSSTRAESGSTEHRVRVVLKPASTQYRFGGGVLVLQFFGRNLGAEGRIEPQPVERQAIPLPVIEAGRALTVDCAPVKLYRSTYKYRSTYGSRYTSESGMEFYGLAVSVFEADGTLACQAVTGSNIEALTMSEPPAELGIEARQEALDEPPIGPGIP